MLQHINVLGYPIVNEPASRVAAEICDTMAISSHSCVFINPHSIVIAERDPVFKRALKEATLAFCDGVGVALASRVLNRRRVERIYGYEFFMALSRELSNRSSGRVFFLGGQPGLLEDLVERYRRDFPGIAHVAHYAPDFRAEFSKEEIDDMRARVLHAGTDVLWVGLGSPKQEKVLWQLMPGSGVRCGAAIGAVFDFYTGRVQHAPAWVRRAGLQWAHRLALEPMRLWRRTFISGPLFVSHVLRQWSHPRQQ